MKCGTPIFLLLAFFLALFLVSQATPTALRQVDTEDEDQIIESPAAVASPAGESEDVPPAASPMDETDEDDEDDEDTPAMASPMLPDTPVAPVTSPAGEAEDMPGMTPVGQPEDDGEDGEDDDEDGEDGEDDGVTPPVASPVAPVPVVETTPMSGVEATPMVDQVESTPMVGDGVPPTTVDDVPEETPSFVAGTQPGPETGTGGSCADAERACILGFAGRSGLQTFNLATTTPNVPFTPAVVSKDPSVSIGILNSNIEGEFIGDDGSVTLFSQAMVEGQSLSPSFFKMLTINGRVSGVAHETPQVGQVKAVVGKCVRVFVTEWQVLKGGRVVDNVNGKTNKRDNVCVVFRTIAA